MKKIAITAAAVAALGLAACTSNSSTDANNTADINATGTAAEVDVNAAAVDANAAVDNTNSALDNAGATIGNAATDAGNAVANTADAAGDAVSNATR
ncbi:MAG: hypothetical protein JOZ90_07030 [Alphaproteobacteria bacterium]|nr:hypothetical protein [Alphaproteobacteria bacterium]MBV9370424.1 hypothetical protein [Alphaproteobacteria bacterium]MBV9900836.1 hypothetical protein [Alphaproteobacteria bacterium]